MTNRAPMDFRAYWNEVGTENVSSIIQSIGSSMSYARLIKYGLKKPGQGFALAFIDAARKITPGWEPNLELMLRGVPRANKASGRTIQPSPEFLASQR